MLYAQGEEKMKNWEINYEKYRSGETEEVYQKLKQKVEERKASQEEVKEYNKMTRIYENLPKIENIKEFMDILDNDLAILKEEYNKRMTQKMTNNLKDKIKSESSDKIAELDSKISENLVKQESVIKNRKRINRRLDELSKIKKENLSEEEKKEIDDLTNEKIEATNDLQKLKDEAKENNSKYNKYLGLNKSAQTAQINNDQEISQGKVEKYTTEELREKCFKISSQMSKCNLVAANLMKGLSMESIDLKLKHFKEKKFTSKTKLPLTREEWAEKDSKKEEKNIEEAEETQDINKSEEELTKEENQRQSVEELPEEDQTKLPIDVNSFTNAFPKLAKIFPKMEKTKLAKFMVNVKQKMNMPKVKKEKTKKQENQNEQETTNSKAKRNKYMDSLKFDVLDVAEKGYDKVSKEKLMQAKKAAYDRESKKFGEEYAKRSFDSKDDGREI